MNDEPRYIRGIRLMDGEELYMALHERHGLLEDVPPTEDFLALTNQRLIGFTREGSRRHRVLLPIQNVEAVEVTDQARGLKPLITGSLMVLAAIGVAWWAAALRWEGVVHWLISGILVVLGAVTASTYVVAEEVAIIAFRTRGTGMALTLRTSQAVQDAYTLATAFFEAKAGHAPSIPHQLLPKISRVEATGPWQTATPPGPTGDPAVWQKTPESRQVLDPPLAEQSAQAERRQDV